MDDKIFMLRFGCDFVTLHGELASKIISASQKLSPPPPLPSYWNKGSSVSYIYWKKQHSGGEHIVSFFRDYFF